MAIKQILNRHWEGLSTDDKPTGVVPRTTFRETDTRANYITYDGTNWEVSDKRVRLVNEDGTYVDLPGEFDTIEAALSGLLGVVALQEEVDVLRAILDGEAILEETGGTLTTDGNEQIVYVVNTPSGIFEPRWFNINMTNHTAAETLVLKTYYKNISGGDWVRDDSETIEGVPDDFLVWIQLKPTRFGIKVTAKKTVGTNRAYVWGVFQEVNP